MKRLLVTALLSGALLGGTQSTAQATGFGIGLRINLDFTGSSSGSNGSCSSCNGCLPPPGWSGYYPQPTMYGGLFANMPPQGCYPNAGYPQQFQGNFVGYNQAYPWMQPVPAHASATPGISNVPPPSPITTPVVPSPTIIGPAPTPK